MSDPIRRLILGPQHPVSNLAAEFSAVAMPAGPVAVIAAGLQEAEGDLDHIQEAINRPLVNLGLYRRAEDIMQQHAEIKAAYRLRQERLLEQQRLYRVRLKPLASAVRDIYSASGDEQALQAEKAHALKQLRTLDSHHLRRVSAINSECDEALDSEQAEPLLQQAEEVRQQLQSCSGVLITGGHVIVLLNRIRLFGIQAVLSSLPLVAWSAGAMVLSSRVVLFHDRSPHGRRDPELLDAGLGIVPGKVFLPDARRRLHEGDELHTGLFARRMAPDPCLTLDSGVSLLLENQHVLAASGIRRISRAGTMKRLRAR